MSLKTERKATKAATRRATKTATKTAVSTNLPWFGSDLGLPVAVPTSVDDCHWMTPTDDLSSDPKNLSSPASGPTPVAWEHNLAFVVLKNLETTDLKSVRLVCKRWDVLCSAIMDFPAVRRLDELLGILGSTKYRLDSDEQVFTLDFDVYEVALGKLNAFIASARGVRKLVLDFTQPTKKTSVDSIPTVAPEVFMALSMITKKNNLSHHHSLFGNLKELVISQYLFPICQYVFTSVFFPQSIQTLTISNLGSVSIQTVFGYLSTIASNIGELRVFVDAEVAKKFKSFAISNLETIQGIRRLECKGVSNEWSFLQALSGGCPNLEKLHVEYGPCSESSESKWRNVKFSSLQSLTLLHVPETQMGNMVSFFQKATFNCIASLEVSLQGDFPPDAGESLLSTLSSAHGSLQSLSISSTERDMPWQWGHFGIITQLKNLQHLVLKGSFIIEDAWLGLLCQGLPKLNSLALEGNYAHLTVNALRWCTRETHHPLTKLTVPIDGSVFKGQPSAMQLPRNLESLSLNVFSLRQDLIPQLAATISSSCPTDATVTFTGSSTEAISSLETAFHTWHSWKKESEMRMMDAMRSIKEELKELREMYQLVVNERDMAMRERKSFEVLVGSVCSDESAEVL
ncbi:hypothetical protein FRC03_004383 [Tulasnella sp. 419]|nr:hypothetical protein FRC03_004383 [Tulasnella sp. 419]